ncbi:MAG TPA: flagellar basal body L-ring protein, partial [Bradyrhizobium sp.]|nr:flagellar basal body L-ring protein [Bradyrhizobium sp.]
MSRFKSKSKFKSGFNRIILIGALLTTGAVASGCSSLDRLSQIGEKPKLTEIENPT